MGLRNSASLKRGRADWTFSHSFTLGGCARRLSYHTTLDDAAGSAVPATTPSPGRLLLHAPTHHTSAPPPAIWDMGAHTHTRTRTHTHTHTHPQDAVWLSLHQRPPHCPSARLYSLLVVVLTAAMLVLFLVAAVLVYAVHAAPGIGGWSRACMWMLLCMLRLRWCVHVDAACGCGYRAPALRVCMWMPLCLLRLRWSASTTPVPASGQCLRWGLHARTARMRQ